MVKSQIFSNCITLIFLFICTNACRYQSPPKLADFEEIGIGSTIKLMEQAIKPYGEKGASMNFNNASAQFKIITYANIYCEPCWHEFLKWKDYFKYFESYPQVSFFFYVNCSVEDFETRNAEANLNFPVLLDARERFKIVNHLGNDSKKLTFLLNEKNEILLVGPPFTEEMRKKYLSIITNKTYIDSNE